ncbi:hypothetical protein IFM89_015388 [Coptis chinensis]|uniref:Uncharacterized protein n=1 Tax=Coptis chinensis TaxID=261450 RepID=A0A835M824_9MAGN|nr:hypothetical protein IFM89_015388 [Coptis chinensis]
MFLATFSVVVAAIVENKRVRIAREHGLLDQPNMTVPISVWWLLPQYVISGLSNVFTVVGMQELFYDQIPIEIRSIGSAMQLSAFGVGGLFSGVLIYGLSTLGLCGFIGLANCFTYRKVDDDYAPLGENTSWIERPKKTILFSGIDGKMKVA